MKKLIVFRLNNEVKKVEAKSVIDTAEILYEGPIGSSIPADVQALVDAEESNEAKAAQVTELYNAMVDDVYAEMKNVFGTDNDVSAQATASTYEAMLKRPASYVGMAGLVDEAAVTAYATTKVAEADAYGVFRLNRIAQFQTEKETILNS